MKTIIFLLIIMLFLISSCKSGYIVTVEKNDEFIYENELTIQEVDSIAKIYLPTCNTDSLLKDSPYFIVENLHLKFYCELKEKKK